MSRQEQEREPSTTFGLPNGSVREPAETNSGGTVADLLVEAHPCSDLHAKRSVERFRYLGVRKLGMWFDDVLDSQQDQLTPEDLRYIRGTWEQWVAGEDPFGLRSHRVTA